MKPEIEQRRETLKALSKVAGIMVKSCEAESINDALVMIYQQQGHSEIHSFKRWLEKGYCVKRGEKALLLWGQPIKATNQRRRVQMKPTNLNSFRLPMFFLTFKFSPCKKN